MSVTELGYAPEEAKERVGFFTDTSICIGCKACEVACKEWNLVPEDGLLWTGESYDNTSALGANTWRHITSAPPSSPYPRLDLTAVVTVTDDGGSSGRLRREFGMLPPGDIRNCMVALAEDEALLTQLFQFRFDSGRGLKGHSFGNLFLTVMTQITGDFSRAVKLSSDVLAIAGRIYPSTNARVALRATLDDGSVVPAEFVLGSVGVRPETSLAAAAGLELGERGGIRVDDTLRTSDPRIWAVGDVAEKVDAMTGEHRIVALAGLANRHGRLAADAITGRDVRVRDALGTAVVGVMGLTIAATGWNEKLLRSRGRDIRVVHTHPASHTGYYPGAETMSLKLLVDAETDAILGAQGVGGEGVDKRIDVIATAIAGGITASELAALELAYAPQYSSAKDPVNMLGYVALNALEGLTPSIQWHELDAAVDAGATVVDVRTAGEVADGAIPGSLRIPLDELRARADELPAGRLIVHCKVGQRGHTAVRLLAQLGRDAVNLDGGYLTWKAGTASRTAVEAEALAA